MDTSPSNGTNQKMMVELRSTATRSNTSRLSAILSRFNSLLLLFHTVCFHYFPIYQAFIIRFQESS